MPDGEELEQRINDQIDRDRIQDKILAIELEQIKRSLQNAKVVGDSE